MDIFCRFAPDKVTRNNSNFPLCQSATDPDNHPDADLNVNEDIPIMSFTRGIKVNGKYKTYSADFHKNKDKIEKSIQNNLSKNEKMVILRLEISDRAKSV